MYCLRFQRLKVALMAAAVFGCITASAATSETAPNVLYTATGTFASPQLSGNDLYQLAGQQFSITVVGNTATAPHSTGTGYADYTSLKLKGTVQSGLDPSPVPITSAYTFIVLAIGPHYDTFEMSAPVTVIKERVTIKAVIRMPLGTLQKGWRIYPFSAPVTLSPSIATVTYTNGTDTTELAVAKGTLNATYPNGATSVSAANLPGGPESLASSGSAPLLVAAIPAQPAEILEPYRYIPS
jgi:hypothetical protein